MKSRCWKQQFILIRPRIGALWHWAPCNFLFLFSILDDPGETDTNSRQRKKTITFISTQKKSESAAVEKSSGLFDSTSPLFRNAVYWTLGMLLLFTACGILWDYGYMRHWRKKTELGESATPRASIPQFILFNFSPTLVQGLAWHMCHMPCHIPCCLLWKDRVGQKQNASVNASDNRPAKSLAWEPKSRFCQAWTKSPAWRSITAMWLYNWPKQPSHGESQTEIENMERIWSMGDSKMVSLAFVDAKQCTRSPFFSLSTYPKDIHKCLGCTRPRLLSRSCGSLETSLIKPEDRRSTVGWLSVSGG